MTAIFCSLPAALVSMMSGYIIAIDFGTSYSGYAYSLSPRWEGVNTEVKLWEQEHGPETPKTPTCILFNDDKEFLKFGYEAKTAYFRMRRQEAQKHYFFENFKRVLYRTKLNQDVMITAANGKEMTAMKVISESLSYLKRDALRTISKTKGGTMFTASGFTWVLTVPATWDPAAQQFMREAAAQARIVSQRTKDKLVIALEPEAASVWCKKLPPCGFISQNLDGTKMEQTPGTQYIVVDCGGVTTDITAYEVLDGGGLKELHKASGNDLGGRTVDRNFIQFLRETFSARVWYEYEIMFPSEVQKLMDDFTVMKQADEDVQFFCPLNLRSLAKRRQRIKKYLCSIVQEASWDDGWITISKEKMESFFANSCKGITRFLREILIKYLNIKFILLVGGFAESRILQQHIEEQFGDKYQVLCPVTPQEAVVRGAVMFGRSPKVRTHSVFTYGVVTTESFDKLKVTTGGQQRCCDIFTKIIGADEEVGLNETREYVLSPVQSHQKGVRLRFYRSERPNPLYVDEPGIVRLVGLLCIGVGNKAAGGKREIRLKIWFGSTEITATATDLASGSAASLMINFVRK